MDKVLDEQNDRNSQRIAPNVVLPSAVQQQRHHPTTHAQAQAHATRFQLVTIERNSLVVPWGLSLALFEGREPLILGDVQLHSAACTTGFWSALLRDNFWTPFKTDFCVLQFTHILLQHPCDSHVEPLLPGDCILAINSALVSKMGATLTELTEYLRQETKLCLLVMRDNDAILAAQEIFARPQPMLASRSYMAALAAYNVYRTRTSQSLTNWQQGAVTGSPFQYRPETLGCLRNCEPILKIKSLKAAAPLETYTNSLFTNENGMPCAFVDNCEVDPEEGGRAALFLQPIDNLQLWIRERKRKWQATYKPHVLLPDTYLVEATRCQPFDSVVVDFWSSQGFSSFDSWLAARKITWARQYSWYQRKRRKLDVTRSVSIHCNFETWLSVRKDQWRINRYRVKRHQQELHSAGAADDWNREQCEGSPASTVVHDLNYSSAKPKLLFIEDILQEEERKRKAHDERPPLDIMVFFDVKYGMPDDVITHFVEFIQPLERVRLLCISKSSRTALTDRKNVWQMLCQKRAHWKLPRRPRRPWHELYLHHLRVETELARKKLDELLSNASVILIKGDHLQSIEKLVALAERDYAFDVNYSSGVVCERNSILNLAVIHSRHKVVRWLVESKNADVETSDRGSFTPLLNAAFGGDKYLVRYLLQKGGKSSYWSSNCYLLCSSLTCFHYHLQLIVRKLEKHITRRR
jgi:hypothetical protein